MFWSPEGRGVGRDTPGLRREAGKPGVASLPGSRGRPIRSVLRGGGGVGKA